MFHVKHKGTTMTQLVTTADVKAHLRIDGTEEDALISQYILAAQEAAETITHRPLFSETDPDAITNDASKLPAQVKQFILVTAGDFYKQRENRNDRPFTVYFEHLLDAWVMYGY